MRPVERQLLLSELRNDPRIAGAIVLSTCNRTEIFAEMLDDAPGILLASLFKVRSAGIEDAAPHFYLKDGKEAFAHLMRVTTSLDSLIIGEQQILGQFKDAVDLSRRQRMMSRNLNVLSQLAIRAGKKSQTETPIGTGGASISWAAVSMAQQLLGTLEGKTVLILGAGKMAHLAAENLRQKGIAEIFVMNRTEAKAESLAQQVGGIGAGYWELKDILQRSDVCICSAGAPHFLLEKRLLEKVMRARPDRPLLVIDISIPRNVDPQAQYVPGVTLVTIDDLGRVIGDNIQKRLSAVVQVEEIIRHKIAEFEIKLEKNRRYQLLDKF